MTNTTVSFKHNGGTGVSVESPEATIASTYEEVSLLVSGHDWRKLEVQLWETNRTEAILVNKESFWLWVRKIAELRLDTNHLVESNKRELLKSTEPG